MPAFDMVVLGCGGGPSECNLSSYLLKPHDVPWDEGMIGLDAGSGLGALAKLLTTQPNLFGVRAVNGGGSVPKGYSAAEIYSWLRCYLITHAHLDHVNGAVLAAGSLPGPPRKVYATYETLKDIETVFSDRLWPNLTSWKEEDSRSMVALIYSELQPNGQYQHVSDHLSVRTMPVSHGRYPNSSSIYDSAAFFIRHNRSSQELLFFGDVEPDSIAGEGRTQAIWDVAADMIPHRLNTIFMECSWPLGRPDDRLYGHLNPEHLLEELSNLATTVWRSRHSGAEAVRDDDPSSSPSTPKHVRKRQKRIHASPPMHSDLPELEQLRGVLDGLRVVIIHCKEDLFGVYDRPINLIIADQVRELVEDRGLGAEVVAAVQGMHLSI
ncbi:3',5'-cyclic-nucleotide phosphodiesterase pde1 [Steccherinum ochraceum]|uniref:3',5'-cyclic-nucleotide phosphodiesterase pde1 n=1 Tax=Steccherinum ochraceum TaxID=92696 RepID=A0A4R0RMH7_9APHY|nr:3',5'-cyclic-nucleotide phosphodiesterase pde1 [Steccherinum ochraceum]